MLATSARAASLCRANTKSSSAIRINDVSTEPSCRPTSASAPRHVDKQARLDAPRRPGDCGNTCTWYLQMSTGPSALQKTPTVASSASSSLCDAATAIDAGRRRKCIGVACRSAASQPGKGRLLSALLSSHALIAVPAPVGSAAPRSLSSSSASPAEMAFSCSRACAAIASFYAMRTSVSYRIVVWRLVFAEGASRMLSRLVSR